jgi:hypothetical protein
VDFERHRTPWFGAADHTTLALEAAASKQLRLRTGSTNER